MHAHPRTGSFAMRECMPFGSSRGRPKQLVIRKAMGVMEEFPQYEPQVLFFLRRSRATNIREFIIKGAWLEGNEIYSCNSLGRMRINQHKSTA